MSRRWPSRPAGRRARAARAVARRGGSRRCSRASLRGTPTRGVLSSRKAWRTAPTGSSSSSKWLAVGAMRERSCSPPSCTATSTGPTSGSHRRPIRVARSASRGRDWAGESIEVMQVSPKEGPSIRPLSRIVRDCQRAVAAALDARTRATLCGRSLQGGSWGAKRGACRPRVRRSAHRRARRETPACGRSR